MSPSLQDRDPPELWGGIECTVNRTANGYRDQTLLSGHEWRVSDLDLFAELGLTALRYPILWERTMPERGRAPDWRWADQRLHRLRALNIRPIVGLVHHGSGPGYTHLLDPDFAAGLARYAGAVAARYPWIEAWTPINEPLTTARFSALYGHWYPHRRDTRSFWLALLNQVDATRAAMRAIRAINPASRLIATDDVGHSYATAPLTDQARYDNARRWAGWDLLFGRVTTGDPIGEELERLGLGDRVRRIADDPCPPDVIGVNHYLTSDRFLDHRLDRYPDHLHGGNGHCRYADTEAVRVLDPPVDGLRTALNEAWARYRTPLAITEVHLGCTREEQLRWATAAWDTATILRQRGVDVRAVTAWSLLGSHGWDTLLTDDGAYEPGVFDVSTGEPRPTALAALWRALPLDAPRHPVTAQAGWWQRTGRLLYPAHTAEPSADLAGEADAAAPLMLLGANTAPGRLIVDACHARALRYVEIDGFAANDVFLDGQLRAWGVVDASRFATDATLTATSIALAHACRTLNLPCMVLEPRASAVETVFGDAGVTVDHFIEATVTDWRGCIDHLLDRLIDGEGGTYRLGDGTADPTPLIVLQQHGSIGAAPAIAQR